MKRIFYISVFVVCAAFAMVSCDEDRMVSTAITVTCPYPYVLAPYSGGTFPVQYKIGNAKSDAYMIAESEESWISDFDFDSVADTVLFYVAEHFEREARVADVMLYYMLDADTLATSSFRVTQEYNSYYAFDALYAVGEYYGMANYYNSEGNMQYSLYISDAEIEGYGEFKEGATYYFLDLWTGEEVEGTSYVSLPEGDYSFGQVGESEVVSGDSQYFIVKTEEERDEDDESDYSEQDYFVGGSLTVERSGGVTKIAGTLEDSRGGIHDISYSGELSLENESLISPLEGDFDLGDFSDIACEARYYGDYYQTGTSNWLLCIEPEVGTGFVIDITADDSYDMDGGVPDGTFTVSSTGGVSGTFLNGVVYNGYLSGTWLVSFDDDGALTLPYAPICGGTIELSVSGSDCTVTINAYDDREYSVTGSWSGTPTVSDCTTSTISLNSNRLGIPKWR